MWRLMKFAIFDIHDQAHFWPVFVPGQPKNMPTRYTFTRFLRLVQGNRARINKNLQYNEQ
jgi:hypothetical protein